MEMPKWQRLEESEAQKEEVPERIALVVE